MLLQLVSKKNEKEAAKDGLFASKEQKMSTVIIFEDLQMTKTIGLFLSEGGVMQPEKSVTALMGLSHIRTGCVTEGCEA